MSKTSLFINIKSTISVGGAALAAFIAPVMPYAWICTAMIAADFISARMLAKRLKRRCRCAKGQTGTKFSSRRFGAVLATLAKAYGFLLLAHGVDCTIVESGTTFSILRFAAALICFWQAWSILENEASANDAPWARIAQRILIDKTERHLGVDLSDLKDTKSEDRPK